MSNAPEPYIELRRQRDFSDVISTGFQYIRQNWRSLYRPLIFICLPLYLFASLLFGNFFRTALGGGAPSLSVSGIGSMFIGYLLMGISMLLLYAMVFEHMRFYMVNKGLPPTAGQLWKQASKMLPSYFVVGLLAALITGLGLVFFVLPGIWLLIVFSMAFPILAFERAEIGACIGRSFKVIRGRWWMTFGMVFVLALLVGFIGYILYLPFLLLTGFGAYSGMEGMENPAELGSHLGWLMTLFMAASGAVNVLLQPFLQVPLGLQALSLIEEKEGRGLMQRVEEMGSATPLP